MNGMLKNKTVLLCISGGIAAYKMAHVASALKKQHCNVHVIMTENATNFITPITFEELTGNKCVVHTFDRNFQHNVEHVALAKQADICLIAPATANVIAKLAHGLADDMLTTTVLACRCPKIVAPAMNTAMYENPITHDNIETLQSYGFTVIPPAEGYLACGDVGAGKLPEPDVLLEYIYQEIAFQKDMKGLRVLVTAGPTQEAIDPVRYITNHSTGKMGYAIAKVAARRGAHVTLVTGKTHLQPPMFVDVVPVISADDMFQAVVSRHLEQDIIIKAAAVADYKPANRGFQYDRETDLPADPACFSNILQRLLRARNDRHAGVYHPLAGGYFISHRLHRFCRRADKDDSFFFAPAGKIRILGQETISGMNRIHLVLLGCSDDLFDIQVTIF